ncbi:MAG: hypothetical protein K2I03_04065 [Lachnospiraceae bacterium]|nr:hypothetical protein [Lachnospiraceae bacterium]
MSMKKVTLLIIANIIVAMVLSGCSSMGKNTSAEGERESIKKLENLKPISEVSQSAYNDLQEAKSRNGSLIYEEIKPYCPETDTVYDIKLSRTVAYKNIDNEKDMLTEQFAITESLLGKSLEELDMECFETNYYNIAEKGNYKSFEEFKNDSQENEKREPSFLSYAEHDETKCYAEYITMSMDSITFNHSKCYEAMHDYRMVHESGITTLTQPRFVCETVKTYYVYDENVSLEDKWNLADGEMSVGEGIDFVENYLNNELYNELKIEGCNKEVKLRVESVDVIKINENYYCFRYRLRWEIGGAVFQAANDGYSVGSMDIWYDVSDGYQVERNCLDMYMGNIRGLKYEKLNETNEILPLSEAIKIIESNIGDNSKYTINGIELGYMALLNNEQTEGTGTVCWVFRCVNELDGLITEFYINAQTGEIKTNSRHP